jgi:hypothetical protein
MGFSASGGLILFTRSRLKNTTTGNMAKKKVIVKTPLRFNALNCDINDIDDVSISLCAIFFTPNLSSPRAILGAGIFCFYNY